MPLHIGLQILLKGMLPLAAVGAGIGGLVYQFTPSNTKSEIDTLEDVLKDLEGPIGDNEFLKEKVKELVDKLSDKKATFNSLQTSLDKAKEEKEKLEKIIEKNEPEIAKLEQEIDEAIKEKSTKEEKEKELTTKKQEAVKKNLAHQQSLKEKNATIESNKKTKTSYQKVIDEKNKEIPKHQAKAASLEKEIAARQAYDQSLSTYKICFERAFGCWAVGLFLNYEDRLGDAVKVGALMNKRLTETSIKSGEKANIETAIKVAQSGIKSFSDEIKALDTKITKDEGEQKTLQETFNASKKEIDDLETQLKPIVEAIKEADSTITTKSGSKTDLTQELATSKTSLLEKTQFIESQSSELAREKADLDRLKQIVEKLKVNNSDNTEIIARLESVEIP